MIKQLLTIVAIGSFTVATAQRGAVAASNNALIPASEMAKASSAPGCQTLTVISPTANVSLYTVQTSTSCTGGYVFGNNCYGDKEIATYFPASYYNGVASPSIQAVTVGFYRNAAQNRGTKGTTNTVTLSIYGGNNTAGPSGAAITSTTSTLAQVVAAQTGTQSLFLYTFTMNPTAIPVGGFFTSLGLPTVTGDTAVIYTQTSTAAPAPGNVAHAWSKDASGWYQVSSTTSGWGLNVNHVMVAAVCGTNITTGVSANAGLSKDVRIMPNPSNGAVKMVVSLSKSENLNVTVTNALGQNVLVNNFNGISSDVVSLDLTSQPNGVYFVTVSNGTEKFVQRLIVSK